MGRYSPIASESNAIAAAAPGRRITARPSAERRVGRQRGKSGKYIFRPSGGVRQWSLRRLQESRASNLVANDQNDGLRCLELEGCADVFVRDRLLGRTERVHVASDGSEANGSSGISTAVTMSSNGRFVAFEGNATNLVPGSGEGDLFAFGVYVRDRKSATTNLVPGGGSRCDGVPCGGVFVRDRARRTTSIVNVGPGGARASNGSAYSGSISANGRFVSFAEFAANLVGSDRNQDFDVFVHDRLCDQGCRRLRVETAR